MIGRLLVALVLLVPAAAGSVLAADWQTYRNARFGFAVDYPADILTMKPAPANDDGRAFHVPGRRIEVTVSAGHNVLDETIGQLYTKAQAEFGPGNISYRRRGAGFFVVSGIRRGRVFYEYVQITRKGGGTYVGRLRFIYPPDEKATMDPVVARMQRRFSTSFREMAPAG